MGALPGCECQCDQLVGNLVIQVNSEGIITWSKDATLVVVPSWVRHADVWLCPDYSDPEIAKEINELDVILERYLDCTKEGKPRVKRCSLGGGIIALDFPLARWSLPAVMMRKYWIRGPYGISRIANVGVHMVVPSIRAKHRAGEEPLPDTPCPLCSIERDDCCGLRIAVTSRRNVSVAGIESLVKVLGEFGFVVTPGDEHGVMTPKWQKWLSEMKLRVKWLLVQNPPSSVNELFASLTFAGARLASVEFPTVFSIHLVGNVVELPEAFIPLEKWNVRTRPAFRPDHW